MKAAKESRIRTQYGDDKRCTALGHLSRVHVHNLRPGAKCAHEPGFSDQYNTLNICILNLSLGLLVITANKCES